MDQLPGSAQAAGRGAEAFAGVSWRICRISRLSLAQRPRNKFSSGVRKVGKVDNHATAGRAKAQLRHNVLDEIGAGHAKVFDAFAGDGAMWRAVWRQAGAYVGCDATWYRDERQVFVADNRRVLRAIDLAPFNVFDLDAYGSPWEQAMIIAARRPVRAGARRKKSRRARGRGGLRFSSGFGSARPSAGGSAPASPGSPGPCRSRRPSHAGRAPCPRRSPA